MADHDDDKPESPRHPDGKMRKGHSANPKGRPPKSRNLLSLFNEKANEKVRLKVNGKETWMTRKEAWVENLWNKAMALDPKASATVVTIMRASGQLEPKPDERVELSEDDAAVLEALIGRLAGGKKGGGDE